MEKKKEAAKSGTKAEKVAKSATNEAERHKAGATPDKKVTGKKK